MLVELDELLVEVWVFLFDLAGKHRVNLFELPREIGQALVAALESLNTEGQSIVVILEGLDDKLDRDLHQGVLDDALVDDASKQLGEAN